MSPFTISLHKSVNRQSFFFATIGQLASANITELLLLQHIYKDNVPVIPRIHDEAGSTSWLYERTTCARRAHVERTSCARRAGLMSWLSGHLNGVILQTFTKLLYERTTSNLISRKQR